MIAHLPQMSLPLLLVVVTFGSMLWGFITGAFNHEVEYRGYFQGLFSKEISPATGLFLSLILFVMTHYFYQLLQ